MAVPLAYYTINTTALDGPKARELRMRLAEYVEPHLLPIVVDGLLARLWQLAAARGEDFGELGKLDNKQLALALGWPYDADALVEALGPSGARLLDCIDEQYAPHDWPDHQPGIQERRRKRDYRRGKSAEDPPASRTVPPPSPQSPVREREGGREGDQQLPGVTSEPKRNDRWRAVMVFNHYAKSHPRAKFDSKRERLVKARLADGFSVDELCLAIDGLERDPFHQGANEQKKKYNDLALYMRDAGKVEGGIAIAQRNAAPRHQTGQRDVAPWVRAAEEEALHLERTTGAKVNRDKLREQHRKRWEEEQAAKRRTRPAPPPNPFGDES